MELALKQIKKYNWDIIYIGHNKLQGKSINSLFVKPYSHLSDNGFNSGFFGYLINKNSIPKLLNLIERFDSPDVDVQMRDNFKYSNVLFLKNPLIFHNYSIPSTRKTINKKNNNPRNQRILRYY